MTPASHISWYRSLPSRVRSPTPANTDTPPWSLAMLLISSMMTTVLPTPAPPNAPTLPPLRNGQMQIDDLDAGREHLGRGRLVGERRRRAVDRVVLLGHDGPALVDGVPGHVEDASHDARADRHRDRAAGVGDLDAALEPLGACHGDGADPAVSEVLLHLERQRRRACPATLAGNGEGVVDPGQRVGELDVHDRAGDLDDPADVHMRT